MSIKSLFGNNDVTLKYLSEKNEKDAFSEVESDRNLKAIKSKHRAYIPQIDYTNPSTFAKFGSAYLYYYSAIERILDFYPYDGSLAEINEFYNKSLDIEKYIFDNLYPRTNGYALLSADGWGSKDGSITNGYGSPASEEYIEFRGGPGTGSGDTLYALSPDPDSSKFQYSNVYDTNLYANAGLPSNYGSGSRESNLKSDFDSGVTVEFWLKKPAFDTDKTEKEVLLDIWNNNAVGSHNYGRLTVFLDGTVGSSATPFYVTVQSGTTNVYEQAVGTNTTLSSIQDWNHYAISLQNSGSDFDVKLYLNGHLDDVEKVSSKNFNELDQIDMMGRIGALITASQPDPSSVIYPQAGNIAAGGKFSGSIDEFRFWKTARTGRQIGTHWFCQVGGGVNTDISNTTLGMYYKFNEGITGTTATDNTVLDYGGRICNGVWVGYDTYSRNTGSAIVESGQGKSEYLDPIVYSAHPDVVTLKTNLLNSGSFHDRKNNSSILNMVPSWIVEEDENNSESDPWLSDLRKVTHIVGTYFDKLHLQISELPKLKNPNYVSGNYTPVPFASHLPQSLGLYTPDIFVNSEIIEKFLNKTVSGSFEGSLEETKNLIYTNIYNNLTSIYKTKGTEASIKNTLRCFYLNDELLPLKIRANNTEFTLQNKLVQRLQRNTSINFNNRYNTDAVIYQAVDGTLSSKPDPHEHRGYISGSHGEGKTESKDSTYNPDGYGYEDRYGFTAEAFIQFPSFINSIGHVDRSQITSSIFGMYTVATGSEAIRSGSETTWIGNTGDSTAGPDAANFQVYSIREEANSRNAYFKITSSNHPYPFPELTSSIFKNIYDNTMWNLSVRLQPEGYPKAGFVTGSAYGLNSNYKLLFDGYSTNLNEIVDSFSLTASITGSGLGMNFVTASKRIYAGAERTNITGAILNYCDLKVSNIKYWGKSLTDSEIVFHTNDCNNVGISSSYQNVNPLDDVNVQSEIPNLNYLFLNWNFGNVTASSADGQFYIDDYSSGSVELRNNYGWLGKIGGYQHAGYGYGFEASSADVIVEENINSFEFIDPEQVVSTDLIKILSDDDKVYGVVEEAPNYHYSVEKSMYDAVSSQMLDFFAGVADFNDVIGHPVHRYRHRYKDLEKLREIFFRRVSSVTHVEKFLDYYKWFDQSLTTMISQLIPGTARFSDDILNVLESHVLERNKYQTQFPTIEFVETDLNTAMAGAGLSSYPWPKGHSPVPSSPRATNINKFFWQKRAKAASTELTTGDATLDARRQDIKDIIHSEPTLSSSIPIHYSSNGTSYQMQTYARRNFVNTFKLRAPKPERTSSYTSFKGGVNFEHNKNIDYTYNALRPAGPVDTTDGTCVPENVLVGWISQVQELPETHLDDLETTNQKTKRNLRINKGRDWTELSYKNTKASFVFPFNLMSSSVKSGYNRLVVENIGDGYEIANLHNDTYGSLMEVPMQGPFTNYAVGGHQSRHIAVNTGSDDYTNRAEAWKLLLGDYTDYPAVDTALSGAIAMVAPDYPWPEANEPDIWPYPMTASHKAWLYRDFVAKRPVNIRNIKMGTGSLGGTRTILGNYEKNYQVVHTFGAFANPRAFVEQQPVLPSEIYWTDGPSSSIGTNVRTFLDIHRTDDDHHKFVSEYSVGYLITSSAGLNKTVIVNKFNAPGGIETHGLGYRDFRGSEYSVYNCLAYKNLTVIKPTQPPAETSLVESTGDGTTGIRVSDVCIDPSTGIGKDYGLRAHLARHSAQFGRDSLFVTGTTSKIDGPETTAGGPGATFNQFPSLHKTQRNTKTRLRIGNTGDYADVRTVSVITQSVYDNYFVNYQIPAADRQYAWVNNSIISSSDFRYYGYARLDGDSAGLYSSSATGYVSYFDGAWVSASSIVPEITQSLYQPTTRLNILTLDSLTGSGENNILGFALTAPNTSYINNDLLSKMQMSDFISGSVDYFNLLLTRRKDTFGWGWRKNQQFYNPIIMNERKNNQLSVANKNRTVTKYNLPPVSMRGRTAKINFTRQAQNTTLKVSNTNQKIFFNDIDLSNKLMLDPNLVTTTFDKVRTSLSNNNEYSTGWILYSQNVFPSAKREFVSSSRERTDYDNKFWRSSLASRATVGNALKNSFNVNRSISQSSWPLDAQQDFLTRTKDPAAHASAFDCLISSGGAGELQNNYFMFHSGVAGGTVASVRNLAPAALYARKHGLSSPFSVAAPTGPRIAETGSLLPYGAVSPFHPKIQMHDVFAGEAKWQAGELAGIIEKSGSTVLFQSHSSEPWFDKYDDFKYDLLKVFKDFAIVPEFRISEHVENYLNLGLKNKGKQNTFEIVGTSINSTTSSFYKDYTNSEFMAGFANIKDDTRMEASEIRLVCSAAIRLNPYKGFYPAQRTIDLVSQFSRSYGDTLLGISTIGSNVNPYTGKGLRDSYGGLLRPLMQALYSPGILFNSIKSGMAVDYPIITDPLKVSASFYGVNKPGETPGNWLITAVSGTEQVNRKAATGYRGGEFFDLRLPFETILKPDKFLSKVAPIDMEPHLSASIYATASLGNPSNDAYSMMMSNFLGEVGNFFLKDSNYTQLKSGVVADDLKFKSGSVYGARIKLRRSTEGPRTYEFESGSMTDNTGYGIRGGQLYSGSYLKAEFPLPQDPRQNPAFRENFTMYSRPSAFGPPIAGRPAHGDSLNTHALNTAPMDSINGFNWAYTPPYTNGEAWCDMIFRPSHTRSYDLEQILAETNYVFWRADPGYATGSDGPTLISSLPFALDPQSKTQPYSGHNINSNAMQLSASLSLQGVERVLTQRKDQFGNLDMTENKTAGKRWVIQPKFETPMMNFSDQSIRPITNAEGTLSLPVFASGSVPRGMWHQFGLLHANSQEGIFIEIEDIPVETLKYHYDVVNNDTVYNNFDATNTGLKLYKQMQSLSDLVGFNSSNSTKRLGELKDNLIVREAIVAVPYTIESVEQDEEDLKCGEFASSRKQFISIPKKRFNAALSDKVNTAEGDSLDATGESIRKLMQKMKRYVLPPQFDFINNRDIDPMVMYLFEFEYEFDKDDLSYIWQNLAPRNYDKITKQFQSTAHALGPTELLTMENICDNENLRWMVFKVKQRSQTHYADLVTSQVGESAKDLFTFDDDAQGYEVSFNWPYDYLSFVEAIKMDVEVLYRTPSRSNDLRTANLPRSGQQISRDPMMPSSNNAANVANASYSARNTKSIKTGKKTRTTNRTSNQKSSGNSRSMSVSRNNNRGGSNY